MAFSERSLDDYVDVAQRIADFKQISADLGREVTSTNELSYVEAQLVLGAKAATT